MQKYFIPGCVGRGLDLGLRVRPSPPVSGNLGFAHLGIEVGKHCFRTAWLITGQEFQGVGLKRQYYLFEIYVVIYVNQSKELLFRWIWSVQVVPGYGIFPSPFFVEI